MKPGGNGVTAKWLLSGTVSVLVMAGAGWLTFVENQVSTIQAEQRKAEERSAGQREDTAVIKEQVQELRKSQERQEQRQEDIGRKLDELLKRR